MTNKIVVNIKSVATGLTVIIATLTGLSGLFSILNYFVRHSGQSPTTLESWDKIFLGFFLGGEINLPTWYASFSLLVCGGLLALTAYVLGRSHPYYRHWWVLSFVFAALSLDEFISVHEAIGGYLHDIFRLSGIFYFSWPILGVAFLACLVLAYFRFVRDLPSQFRRMVMVAGIIYIGGALGMEVLEGYYFSLYTGAHLAFELMIYIEEILEMVGVALFIIALCQNLKSLLGDKTLEITIH